MRTDAKLAVGLALVGASLYALALPPVEITPVAWAVPLVWLAMLQRLPTRRKAAFLFLGGYAFAALSIHWLFGLFSWLSAILWLVPAAYFAVWGALAGMFRGGPVWLRVLWPAVSWVGIEYLRCEIAPLAFPFLSLGSTQANALGFGLASVVGVYGVSFIMMLCGSLIVNGWNCRWRYAWIGGAVAVPLVIYSVSALMLARQPEPVPLGTALLQQLDQDDDLGGWSGMPWRSADSPVDLVVWPELTLANDPRRPECQWFTAIMQADAAQTRWGNVFGAVRFPEGSGHVNDPFYNTAWYMQPNGELAAEAGKNQPVQLINDGMPAEDVRLMNIGEESGDVVHVAGVGVCYDGAFQQYSRRMTQRGAEYLVFPTMNLEAWGTTQHTQHLRLFQFRAAETGRTVLVSAVSGPTFAAMPGGQATPRADYHATQTISVLILSPVNTLYNCGGWLMGPLCLALSLAGFIGGTVGRKLAWRFRKRPVAQEFSA